MVPINNHFSPLPELPPLPPGFILPPGVFALFSQGPVQDEKSAAKVDVVSRIVVSCVVAHAFHAWVLVSPSVTTRCLIRNPVANIRCACKASQNPPRSLIGYRSCIWHTRVSLDDACANRRERVHPTEFVMHHKRQDHIRSLTMANVNTRQMGKQGKCDRNGKCLKWDNGTVICIRVTTTLKHIYKY